MPNPSEAVEMVRDDVQRAIGELIDANADVEDGGFRILEELGRAAEGDGIWSQELGVVAVPWGYRGRHVGPLMGFQPTNQVMDLRGVTIVEEPGEGEDGPQFSRFIDWVGALATIGVGLFKRPIEDDPVNAGVDPGPPSELQG